MNKELVRGDQHTLTKSQFLCFQLNKIAATFMQMKKKQPHNHHCIYMYIFINRTHTYVYSSRPANRVQQIKDDLSSDDEPINSRQKEIMLVGNFFE